jgi:tetratricopeptide (TPR) repeat protein
MKNYIENTSQNEVYQALLRCLKRTKGFGIVFVQCSPAVGTRLIDRVQEDLAEKKIAILELTEPIDNLYDIVASRGDRNDLNILFIQGLENSLEPYIKPGYGGDGDYYNLDTVPPILSHLNQRREIFRDRLSNICFVFILSFFAIKYIIRRAPDFFDWGSGVFKLPTDSFNEFVKTINIIGGNYSEIGGNYYEDYSFNRFEGNFTHKDNNKFIDNRQEVGMIMPTKEYQKNTIKPQKDEPISLDELNEAESWIKRGNVLLLVSRYEEAIQRYELAIRLNPNSCEAWNLRGIALLQLGRYQESIASFDKALEINPDYQEAKTNRDIALKELN